MASKWFLPITVQPLCGCGHTYVVMALGGIGAVVLWLVEQCSKGVWVYC
jgi:hypothetical protein